MQEERATHGFTEGQRINGRFRQHKQLEQALEEGYFEFECIETLDVNSRSYGQTCTVFYLITKENNLYTLRKYKGTDSYPLSQQPPSSATTQQVQDGQLYSLVTRINLNLRPFRWYPNISE